MERNLLADPWRAAALADAAVERAAQELRQVLVALATALDPFPGFQGMQTIHAVEVELENAPGRGHGCVVVGPDGVLYELVLHAIPGPLGEGDADQVDELRELDLKPQEYVQYAYQAIKQLAELHRQHKGP
ncbi:MAG: hypothetical protein HY681_00110 [Chloroflexi bacterium]|nr:hypothetical protein [Chloroflexota bacterium]